MRKSTFCLAAASVLLPGLLFAGDLAGKVTVEGTVPKPKVIDMSKEPACAKSYSTPPTTETVVTGPSNALENVVVYVSQGANDASSAPPAAVTLEQKGCRYIPHVVALKVNQELKIANDDPTSHNIHPLAKTNREWNKSQPPGSPPLSAKFDQEEFIPVKCNVHPWMHSNFAVLKTGHFDVSKNDGSFSLKDLPPGKYTITAWHESLGTQTQDVTVGAGATKPITFVFKGK
jgi:plastocyanin